MSRLAPLFPASFLWRRAISAALLLSGAGASACTPPPAAPVAADAVWAQQRWPGTTLGDLTQGRAVFVARCSSCHNLPDPAQKTADEWPAAVNEMAARAKLTSDQAARVSRYLGAMSVHAPGGGG